MVELVRIDINTEVLMLVLNLSLPSKGHLESVIKIVYYLQGKHNSRSALDLNYPDTDHVSFKKKKGLNSTKI